MTIHQSAKFLLTLPLFLWLCVAAKAQHLNSSNLLKSQHPLFIENKGQVVDQNGMLRPDVKFIYSAPGFKLVLKDNSFSYELYTISTKKQKDKPEISEANGKPVNDLLNDRSKTPDEFTIHSNRIDVELTSADPHSTIIAEGGSTDYSNYYLPQTPDAGTAQVYSYSKITYHNIYPHIDFAFYAKEDGRLKYDIIVRPGGRLSDIKMLYKGMNELNLQNNSLSITTNHGSLTEEIPLAYLEVSHQLQSVTYSLHDNCISFKGDAVANETLVVDPVIGWATYYGGSGNNEVANAVTTDSSGNVYMAGYTASTSSIATSGAFQTTNGGNYDVFLVKFNSSGARQWATYYGGTGSDYGNSVAVDASGNVYVGGNTGSTTVISTTGAHQTAFGGGVNDGFVVKFNSSGARQWGTYYGGTDTDMGISVTTDGSNVFMCGYTFSTTGIASSGAYQTALGLNSDIFLVKFNSSGVRQWGTYYGGTSNDFGYSVATDASGNVYMGARTGGSANMATAGAYQTSFGGTEDALLIKFSGSGSRLWATYYGGGALDIGAAVTVDNTGYVYLAGQTASTTGIASSNGYQTSYAGGNYDGFLARFNSSGVRQWSTYYGGSNDEIINAVDTDDSLNVYVSGFTNSTSGIATANAYQTVYAGTYDAFVARLKPAGSLGWGTYYGGPDGESCYSLAVDRSYRVYIAGTTNSTSKIATAGAYQTVLSGYADAFLASFSLVYDDAGVRATIVPKNNHCGQINDTIQIKVRNFGDNTITSVKVSYTLNGKPGNSIVYNTTINPLDITGFLKLDTATFIPGKNTLKLWTSLPNGRTDKNPSNDTFIFSPVIYPIPVASFTAPGTCANDYINIKNTSTIGAGGTIYSWLWKFSDGTSSTDTVPVKKFTTPGVYTVWLIAASDQGCLDSTSRTFTVYPRVKPAFSMAYECTDTAVTFMNTSTISSGTISSFLWKFGDGTTSTLQNPVKTYASPGLYTVWLIVSSDNGCRDSLRKNIIIYPRFRVSFNADSSCQGKNISFTNTSSISSGSLSYLWKFGDGNTSSAVNPVWKYASAGTYTVTLLATTSNGCTDSFSRMVKVFDLPKAGFTLNNHCADSAVSFSNTSTISSGAIASYLWTFGDNSTSTLQSPVHQYTSPGKYIISLKVISDKGCTDSITKPVTIYALPDSVFTVTKIKYRDNSFAPKDTLQKYYLWQFGDGDTSSSSKPKHTYKADGTYSVRLLIKNANGCVSQSMQKVTVNTTGIQTFAEQIIRLYPNPFTGSFKLEREGSSSEAFIEVFNITGECFYQAVISGNMAEINLSNAAPGMYFVRVNESDRIFTAKLIKE